MTIDGIFMALSRALSLFDLRIAIYRNRVRRCRLAKIDYQCVVSIAYMTLHLILGATNIASAQPQAQSNAKQKADKQSAAKEAFKNSNKKLRTIGLKCADANGGVLDVFRRNEEGLTVRIRYEIKDNEITRYIIEAAISGEKLQVIETWSRNISYSDDKNSKAKKEIELARPITEIVCKNSEYSRRFEELMEKHRNELAEWSASQPLVPPHYFKLH